MRTFKQIAHALIRSMVSIMNMIEAVLIVLFFSKFNLRQGRNISVNGKSCVILGNGPSLKDSLNKYRDFLKNKVLFCTNDFIDSPFFQELKPTYYLLMDPVYWNQGASARFQEMFKRYSSQFSYISWPMTLVLPSAAKRWNYFLEIPKQNSFLKIAYVNTAQIRGPQAFRYWLYDHNLAMPLMHNVLVAATYLGVYFGFKSIFFFGGDHSWFKNIEMGSDNALKITNNRVHDQMQSASAPFFSNIEETKPYTMPTLFYWLADIFQGHWEASDYAKKRGAKVFNASEVSYIDAYERYSPADNRPAI